MQQGNEGEVGLQQSVLFLQRNHTLPGLAHSMIAIYVNLAMFVG